MLRDSGAICGAINPSAHWYDPMWFAQEQELHGISFTLLSDRNVYSRAVELADGDTRRYDNHHRAVAGPLCFAHCCGLRIDWNMAVLEQALDSDQPAFKTEVPKIRQVFASQETVLADFALGRTSSVSLPTRGQWKEADRGPREKHRPDLWNLNYACALKLASLMLDSTFASDDERLIAYFVWCFDEFYFSAGATLYGSLALSPRRRRDMFKSLRGGDVQRAFRGIRNAAWDMTLISEWEKRQRRLPETRAHVLIGSLDKVITDVAQTVMCQGLNESKKIRIVQDRFKAEWGDLAGDRIFKKYACLSRDVDCDVSRPPNQSPPHPRSYWNAKIAQIETALGSVIANHTRN